MKASNDTRLPAISPGALTPELQQRLRRLAFERLDAEIFDHLFPCGGAVVLAEDDLQIVAAALREAARQFTHHVRFGKPDREIARITDFVETLLACGTLPASPRAPFFREYVAAVLEWIVALRDTFDQRRFWPIMEALLGMELLGFPDLHERLIGVAAEFGPAFPAAGAVTTALARFVARPYLCTDPNTVLIALAGALQGIIEGSDVVAATGRWLGLWRFHLGSAKTGQKQRQQQLLKLRTAVHGRLGLLFRTGGLLRREHGSVRVIVTLLLIKLDLYLFIRSGLAGRLVGAPWLNLLRFAFRRLGARGTLGAERPGGNSVIGLRLRAGRRLTGSRSDIVLTRAQGGLGDILMMRPGLIALAKQFRRRGGRVVFATNRGFFPVFSTDDPIELVDIDFTEIDVTSFGEWRNLTNCPADARETREFPKLRTNRIEIFAGAMGARLARWRRDRSSPIRFPAETAAAARTMLNRRARPGLPCIGVQYRSAESYRDVPFLLDAARQLSKRYNVFVFDNRPIPLQAGDSFIAIDSQPLPIVLAMVAQMDALIAPDSIYVHVAGANNIPCLALFGPTGGRLRTSGYPSVRYLDASDTLACIPCWRNEFVRCAVGRGYQSVCLNLLTAPVIVAALEELLAHAPRQLPSVSAGASDAAVAPAAAAE